MDYKKAFWEVCKLFDAYIHYKEKQIKQLEDEINELRTKSLHKNK